MTSADGSRPDHPEPRDGDAPLDDGPVIDPLDPLGLGDLRLDDVPLEELPPDLLGPPRRPEEPAHDRRVGHGGDVATVPDGPEGGPPTAPLAGTVTGDRLESAGDREHVGEDAVPAVPEEPEEPEAGSVDAADAAWSQQPESVRDPGPAAAPAEAAGDSEDLLPTTSGPPSVPTSVVPRVVVRPPRSGWARLAHAMRPRTTQGQLITAGLCALLGFALVVQVRQATDTQLGSLRQNDLVRLLDETTTRTEELEREALDLQRERDELVSGSDRQQAALDAARRTAAMQGILTGRLPATGPGVRITLTEPDGEIRPVTMLHVLEELRNAGAEAMELNGHRIIASSSFTGNRGAVELDGAAITSPFRWTVIGAPDTIAPALEIPGGAMAQVRGDGGRGTVEKSDRVEVTAVRVLPDPVHATPVSDEP